MITILLVEDSTPVRDSLAEELSSRIDSMVYPAAGFEEARCLLEDRDFDIDLAVLDLVLPDAPDGEIVDFMLEKGIPSIVVTSKFDEETRKKIIRKDVIDYIIKDSSNVIANVADLVERLLKNRSIRILVVDDSVSRREGIIRLLERYFFTVSEAENGEQALSIIEEGTAVDLVLTDYLMPVMDGFKLTKRLRRIKNKHELAIIGSSASGKPGLTARFLKEGANDFLTVPFEKEELYCRVVQNVETLERFRESERLMQEKNTFIGMAAHDLRTPLASINGIAQMLESGMTGALNAEQKEFCGLIRESSESMLELINNLLDVSMIESGKLTVDAEYVSLDGVIKKRIDVVRYLASEKNISIEAEIEKLPPVFADERLISQVVDNLLSNALKFSPPGSTVRIRTACRDSCCSFSVLDEGPGIPDEKRRLLFQSFSTVGSQTTGGERSTGLGLAIVRRIVEAHKGEIQIHDGADGGTEFKVLLPV